jgi:uncharacterized protein YbbK (DUF523 family)
LVVQLAVILVSACLLGVPFRFDGGRLPAVELPGELAGQALLPICPEELGGLPTPRPAAELSGGDGRALLGGAARAVRAGGEDVTAAFLRGAEAAVELARRHGCRAACLKSKSPSCGVRTTHIDGQVRPGMGAAAAALERAGLRLIEAG